MLPPGTGVTGWAALRWMGAPWCDGTTAGGRQELAVDLVASCREIRSQPGFVAGQERLNPLDLVEHDGLCITVAARSTCFAMRYAASLTAAVVAADMAAYSDLVSIEELSDYIAAHPGWTGVPRARKALHLVSENSWSPMESQLRMLWILRAGLPAPRVNPPVFDARGRHVATPDLLDPDAGLAVEYDGKGHLRERQRLRDVQRERAMREVGLEYLTVLRHDVLDQDRLAGTLVRARRRAAALRRDQTWTLTPPPWWTSHDTVDERRRARQEVRQIA